MPLPEHASSSSRRNYELARSLSHSCPHDLGREIAVTGSVSRGVADRFSDVELNFWVEDLPEPDDALAWLRRAGANPQPMEPDARAPGSFWTKSWYRGVFVEASWQTLEALARDMEAVLSVSTTDHWQLTGAWHVADAAVIREGPDLELWQHRLRDYPGALGTKLIEGAVAGWADPHWYPSSIVNLWPLVYRYPRLALANRLIGQVERVLRIVFALNSRWEPDWKWLASESRRLQIQPRAMVDRVDQIVTVAQPERSALLCLELVAEVLDLLPSAYNVEPQKRLVQEAMEPMALLPEARRHND